MRYADIRDVNVARRKQHASAHFVANWQNIYALYSTVHSIYHMHVHLLHASTCVCVVAVVCPNKRASACAHHVVYESVAMSSSAVAAAKQTTTRASKRLLWWWRMVTEVAVVAWFVHHMRVASRRCCCCCLLLLLLLVLARVSRLNAHARTFARTLR